MSDFWARADIPGEFVQENKDALVYLSGAMKALENEDGDTAGKLLRSAADGLSDEYLYEDTYSEVTTQGVRLSVALTDYNDVTDEGEPMVYASHRRFSNYELARTDPGTFMSHTLELASREILGKFREDDPEGGDDA